MLFPGEVFSNSTVDEALLSDSTTVLDELTIEEILEDEEDGSCVGIVCAVES